MALTVRRGATLTCWLVVALLPIRLAANDYQVGYAIIQAGAGQAAPVASALFSYRNSTGTLVSEAAVGAVETMRSGRIFVDQQGTSTGIAFANPSPQPVQLELLLRNSQGVEINRKTISLPAKGHLARFVTDTDLFPGTPAEFTGSLTFTCLTVGSKVAAVTIRQGVNSHGEPLFTTLPVANLDIGYTIPPGGSRTIVFPHLGAGGPLSTQIVLFNPTGASLAGLIRLIDSNGNPLQLRLDSQAGSEFPFQLGPNATYRGALTTASGVFSGYAIVRVDSGNSLPVGTAVFQFRDGAGIVSEAGVGSLQPTRTARIFVDTVGTQTGVALASPGNAALDVQFRLYSRSGLEMGTTSRKLAAGGHIGIFADQLFTDLPPLFTGVLEVRSPAPVVPITLKLSTNSRQDLILTTLPVADLENPSTASMVVLPQVGFGLGFSTRLIFVNPGTISALQGTLSFTTSDGSPMVLPMAGETGSQFNYGIPSAGAAQFRPGNSLPPAEILINPASSASDEIVLNQGNTLALGPVVLDTGGNPRDDFPLSYSSVSEEVAVIDPLGRVQGLSAGFSTITVTTTGLVAAGTVTVVDVTSGASGLGITGIVQDQSNRLYLANSLNHTILLAEDLNAPPDLYAGQNRTPGLINDVRSRSRFDQPSFLAIDKGAGTIYVSDTANHVLRQVEPGSQGRVQTLSGSGAPGSGDGPRQSATFNRPAGVALDEKGFLWVADSNNHSIRRVNLASGAVTTVAGKSGSPGLRDGSGDVARFRSPTGIAVIEEPLAERLQREALGGAAPPVKVVVADTGNGVIREVREDGQVRTLRITAPGGTRPPSTRAGLQAVTSLDLPTGIAADPFGNIYVTDPGLGKVHVLLRNGQLVEAIQGGTVSEPRGLTIDESGKVTISGGTRIGFEISYGPPRISSLSPPQINVSGGQTVQIRGRNFAPDTVVVVAGTLIEPVDIRDTEAIHFRAPQLPSGRTTLTLINRGGVAQTALLVTPPPITNLKPGYIATLAGGSTFAQDGAQATSASLSSPRDVAVDPLGNLVICDTNNNRIRRVDARTGIITTLAGSGLNGFQGDGGPALTASFSFPSGVAADRAGRVFVADSSNSRIRVIDSSGTIQTFAGNGFIAPLVPLGDGGPATEAAIALPADVALDPAGNVYIADSLHNRIRAVSSGTGVIQTIAGNGEPRFSGDGGQATQASLNFPQGLALDEQGNHLFIADTFNHRVRRVDLTTGIITTIAGTGVAGHSGDNGSASQAKLDSPERLAVDFEGNLYIADASNFRVRRVDTGGVITTVAGGGSTSGLGDGGPASLAFLALPSGVAIDSAENLVIADTFNHRIRLVSSKSDSIETVAGGGQLLLGDGEQATAAFLQSPSDVAVDSTGAVLIADQSMTRIRRVVQATGVISTAAGGGDRANSAESGIPATEVALVVPSGVSVDVEDNIYIADATRVRKVDPRSGLISTLAGDGSPPDGIGDGGLSSQAAFNWARGVRADGLGSLYVVDAVANRVRRLNKLTGLIETVAGGGNPPDGLGDGLPPTQASLAMPAAISLDSQGNLFIADTFNNRIRRVDVSGSVITTVAGNGKNLLTDPGPIGDNGPATQALVNLPTGVVVDDAGNLFLSDLVGLVRRVDAQTGIITTIAGGGHPEDGIGDLLPATEAALGINLPSGLAISSTGDLLIADTTHGRVRIVRGAAPAGPALGTVRVSLLEDDAESDIGIWSTAGSQGASTWHRASDRFVTPTHSWFAQGLSSRSEQRLTTSSVITLPSDAGALWLTFWHSYEFEAGFDGGVVEVSIDGGQSWLDAGPAIFINAYSGTLIGADNPLFGRQAFTGTNLSYPAFNFSAIDLTGLAGEQIRIRFRAGTDSGVGSHGWNMDDMILSAFWLRE